MSSCVCTENVQSWHGSHPVNMAVVSEGPLQEAALIVPMNPLAHDTPVTVGDKQESDLHLEMEALPPILNKI